MQLKKRYIGGMLIMIIWTVYHIIIEQWGLASIGFVSLGIITIMLAWAYPSFLGLRHLFII